MLRHFRARPRLTISIVAGCLVGAALPGVASVVTRALIGWNVAVWMFLVLIGLMMLRADPHRLRRAALAQAEGAATVLVVVTVAALVTLAAIVYELSAAKGPDAHHALPRLLFALVTVAGTWLLVPTLFSLNYASQYHVADKDGGGLKFPDESEQFEPDYSDFLYFSFTIAVASQTADVVITNRSVRRLVLLQSVLSFVFNTTVLAFMINMAASLF